MKSISDEFWRKWKFPNCVGCIDGKHIRIKAPQNSGSMFYNYKHFFSIVLQAVTGPNYRFITTEVGAFGKESDGGVFTNSNLCKQLENGALNVKSEKCLPGSDIRLPHVILGDEAYPLKNYLMRPYPQRSLGPEELIYNKRLTNARQVVECAFGIMTSKWRLLTKSIEVSPERADIIVQCICLLHNIIIDKEGLDNNAVSHVEANMVDSARRMGTLGENRGARQAYAIRDVFQTFFNTTNQ